MLHWVPQNKWTSVATQAINTPILYHSLYDWGNFNSEYFNFADGIDGASTLWQYWLWDGFAHNKFHLGSAASVSPFLHSGKRSTCGLRLRPFSNCKKKRYINSEILLNPSVHYHIHTTISSRQEDIMMICPMQFSKTFKLLAVSGAQFGITTFQFNSILGTTEKSVGYWI